MRTENRRSGFTLVELLVVIAIIGLLATAMVPALNAGFRAAEKHKAAGVAKDVEGALKAYYTEYGEFPEGWESKDAARGADNGKVVKALLNVDTDAGKGKNSGVNWKGIVFVEFDQGTREAFDKNNVLQDPWGEPYEILMDMNLDDEIASGTGSEQTVALKTKVAVQSSGPDKKWGTKDDIKTW